MSFLNLEQLPFVGMSHEFVGEKEGAPFSAYIVTAKPRQGPPGLEEDIVFCAREDILDVVPRLAGMVGTAAEVRPA